MPTWILILCEFSTIACALVGGVFLTFSDFAMRSFNRANAAAGIEVMQVINREVYKSIFMVLLLGMSALSALLVGYALIYLDGAASTLIVSAGAIYLLGVFAVTALFNVPMNTRLDTDEFSSPEASSYWRGTYFPRWTLWNHVRVIASIAAAVCYLMAGVSHAQSL